MHLPMAAQGLERKREAGMIFLDSPKGGLGCRTDIGARDGGMIRLLRVALSVKRSLVGHAGQLSDNRLINGIADNKIGGRNYGQKGRQWH